MTDDLLEEKSSERRLRMNTLWEALDRLADGERWTKMTGYKDGSRCLLGAIGNTESADYITCVCREKETRDAAQAVADVILAQFGERIDWVVGYISTCRAFNDHPDTTWEDVRLVLEKAALSQDEILS